MLSKNQVKYLHSLRLGKFRDLNRVFLAEGIKLVDELLNSRFTVQSIYATKAWFEAHPSLTGKKEILFQEITDEELRKISNLVTPNEVIAVVCHQEPAIPTIDPDERMILVLDRMQDPGNLGTIIRTADWFGIKHIFCSEDTVDAYNPKVVQSTMGSLCRVSLHYVQLTKFLQDLGQGWNIYGTIPGGENLYGIELFYPAAIVVGNESKGISADHFHLLTHRIGIPSGSEGAESLNASVAAGIVMAEFSRKLK
jgi:RNA methyltransferase, TrmH family